MPVISWEKWDSREPQIDLRGDGSTGVLTFIVEGTTSEETALTEVHTNRAPGAYIGMVLDRLTAKRIGQQHWEVAAEYTDPEAKDKEEPPAVDELEISFDTTGGTLHITHSIKDTVEKKLGIAGYTPHFGAIGVSQDGPSIDIEGCDIIVPALALSIRTRKQAAFLTNAYIQLVAGLTGTTNKNPFKGFDAGELLFAGGGGTQRQTGEVDLTYSFLASANRVITKVGGTLLNAPLTKRGHDYFWVFSKPKVDTATNSLTTEWQKATVAQVYEEADWAPLGLGN
jgi:hypothetical protein